MMRARMRRPSSRPWFSSTVPGARAHWLLGRGFQVDVAEEGTTIWTLLQQHLAGDAVWNHLKDWRTG